MSEGDSLITVDGTASSPNITVNSTGTYAISSSTSSGSITLNTGGSTLTGVVISDPWQEAEDRVEALEEELEKLKDDIAEAIILGDDESIAVSVYEMDCETYSELPGNVRL